MGELIDLSKEFKLQMMKNRSLQLAKDVGGGHQLHVITKENPLSEVGYDVYLMDKASFRELLIDPVKLDDYFKQG